ncbi:MAG TPA: NeuD/PglB/VioB family sugar acetyltransferase [Sphingomicrobium sp.]
MKPFVIVGTGGMGRELLGWIAGCRDATRDRFRVAAFISEAGDAGTEIHGVAVHHPDEWTAEPPRFVMAFADPVKKKRLALDLEGRGWEPETFIHDSAVVGLDTKIGRGTVICPFCRISTDCVIGEHVLVNGASGIGHDATVGDYSSLLGSVSVNGSATVGEGVTFGAGSMVYPGKRIGAWATVGLASVVLRNVPSHATVFGNPALRIDQPR